MTELELIMKEENERTEKRLAKLKQYAHDFGYLVGYVIQLKLFYFT